MLLQKWQTNEIFKAIEGVSLNPNEFEFDNTGMEALLKYKWSKSYFVIGGNAGHYIGNYVVGDGVNWPYEVYSWEPVMSRFSRWVKEVKDDVDTPDLWAELQRDASLPVVSLKLKSVEERLTSFPNGRPQRSWIRTIFLSCLKPCKSGKAASVFLVD
jgi:hypothetical protein